MDDLLKGVLGAPGAGEATAAAGGAEEGDPLSELLGTILGDESQTGEGGAPDQEGLLETFLSSKGKDMKSDPVLAPMLERVAKKLGLSSEMAELVVGFALDKLASRRRRAKSSGRKTAKKKTSSSTAKKKPSTGKTAKKKTSSSTARKEISTGKTERGKKKASSSRKDADSKPKAKRKTSSSASTAKRKTTSKPTDSGKPAKKKTTTKRRKSTEPADLDLGDLLDRIGRSQDLDATYVQSSGLADELSRQTGLEATKAATSLQEVLSALGRRLGRPEAGSGEASQSRPEAPSDPERPEG